MKAIAIAIATAMLLTGCAGNYGPVSGPVLEHEGPTQWEVVRARSIKDGSLHQGIQTKGHVLVTGGAFPNTVFWLMVNPCAKVMSNFGFKGSGKVGIHADYVNLYGGGGWYKTDEFDAINMAWEAGFGSKLITPSFGGLIFDHHAPIIERIKRARSFIVSLPYYQGDVIVEFDVRGAAKELNKIYCN